MKANARDFGEDEELVDQASSQPNGGLWSWVMFAIGFFVWIFKPTYGNTPLIPFSPLQIGIPLIGLISLGFLLAQHRSQLPVLIQLGPSSFLFVLGNALILLGSLPFVAAPGDARVDAILYILRWLMPACLVLFFYIALEKGAEPTALVAGVMAGAVGTAVCVELARAGLNLPIHRMSDARYAGFLQHANQYGILISGSAPFIVYLLYCRHGWARLLGAVMIPVYCLGLFQCMSKTNLVLFPVALLLGLLCMSLRSIASLAKAGLILTVLVLVLGLFGVATLELARQLAPQDAAVLERMINDPRDVKSLDERNDIWEEAIGNIRRHPYLGVGPGWTVDHMSLPHAHNLVLQIWLETGITGLIGILIIIVGVSMKALVLFIGAIGEREIPSDGLKLQRMAGIGGVISLFGNSMSASLGTPTMMMFVMIVALCFVQWPLEAHELKDEVDHDE